VLISGASGLIGSAVVKALRGKGSSVTRLVRQPAADQADAIGWNPAAGSMPGESLNRFDTVIHLAGENIASRRWTASQKQRIVESRVRGTRLISEAVARAAPRPRVLACASAIGYYGDRGDELLSEESRHGSGFLADVCQQWENAAEAARQAGIRVVHMRFGVVLSPDGGALAKMLTPFRLGLGGRIGSGRQYISWVELSDVAAAVLHSLATEELSGPVNIVSPEPVTNREFTQVLGRVLHRPTIFPVPAPIARLALGQMADELLLASTRVRPQRLVATGFNYRYPALEPALRHLLDKS